jgi:hypothetical protein
MKDLRLFYSLAGTSNGSPNSTALIDGIHRLLPCGSITVASLTADSLVTKSSNDSALACVSYAMNSIAEFSACLCLFSWRYNSMWLYFTQPGSGLEPPRFRGLLLTHKDAQHSVGLLWTSDQSVAETST